MAASDTLTVREKNRTEDVMTKSFGIRLGVAAIFLVTSFSVQAAVIVSAQIVDLYSATFDGALTPDGSLFFGGDPDLNPRNIAVTSFGPGSGTIEFDGTTITQLDLQLPDMQLVILAGDPRETTVVTDSTLSPAGIFLNITTPATDNTPGFAGFQVEASPAIIADFATFSTFIDAGDDTKCYGAAGPGTGSGPLCGLISILSLDGTRYQLDGSVTPGGGDSLLLTIQQGNGGSIYEIALTTATIPVPAAFWLFGSALGLLGWMRSKAG